MTDQPGRVRSTREVIRYRIGWWASEPFWRLHCLGDHAMRVHDRLIAWAGPDPDLSAPARVQT